MRDDSRAKKHNSTPPYNPMNASTIYRREGNNNNQPRTSSSSTNNHQPPTTIDSTMSPPYYYLAPNTRSWSYQQNCITKPISSSAIGAIIFSALDVVQGRPVQVVFTPRAVGSYFAFLYTYHVIQCPMEAIHGRPSLWHNIISGGFIGYIGVQRGILGIPFINPYMVYYQTGLSPPLVAFGVYGGMAGIFAGMLGGKPF